jgi:hypothetical protein
LEPGMANREDLSTFASFYFVLYKITQRPLRVAW